ncbi:MAG: hypothetical protein AB8H86_07950 [Polyangiales bacterium]
MRTIYLLCLVGCGSSTATIATPAEPSHQASAAPHETAGQPADSPGEGDASERSQAREEAVESPAEASPAETSRWESIASDANRLSQLFDSDCTLTPTLEGALVRRTASPHDFDDWDAALPQRFLRHLEPSTAGIFRMSAEGRCEPRLGTAKPLASHVRFSEVAQRLGRCRQASTFVFSACELPPSVAYERLQYRIERVRRGGEVDARARSLFESQESIHAGITGRGGTLSPGWQGELRRRWRSATLRLEEEELAFIETHWQLGEDNCSSEAANAGVFRRELPDGEWQPLESVTTQGVAVGVYHDGRRALGVEVHGRLDGGDRATCQGAADCEGSAYALRNARGGFSFGFRRVFGFTSGNLVFPQGRPPLHRYNMECVP